MSIASPYQRLWIGLVGAGLVMAGGAGFFAWRVRSATPHWEIVSAPKEHQTERTLTDGTRMTLNAGSSARYMSPFDSNSRDVNLDGEGYFVVAHDARRPFHVNVNGGSITDIGTEFDVRRYDGEETIRIAVVQGEVCVTTLERCDQKVKAHQLAVVRDTTVEIVPNADVAVATAWIHKLNHD